MGVVAADRAEENLAIHREVDPRRNQFGDHVQLRTKSRARKHGLEAGGASQRGSEQIISRDRTRDRVGVSLFKEIVVRQREQILKGLEPNVRVRAPIEPGESDAAVWRND